VPSDLNFIGNVEGDGIYKGDADVIVCDGFVGNVALKTSEGLAQMLASSLRGEFKRNWLTKIAALIAISVLNNFKKRFDHRRYNGAILLGLKGISVKSHGSADAWLLETPFRRAFDAAENRVVERIASRIAAMIPAPATAWRTSDMYARLIGTGSYLPGNPVSNDDLAARGIDTNDEWIVTRTGIRSRYLADRARLPANLA
jgi:hypothetical protein